MNIINNTNKLFKYVKNNKQNKAIKLLQKSKVNLNATDKNGDYLIFFIISHNMIKLFKYILDNNKSINLAIIHNDINIFTYPLKIHMNMLIFDIKNNIIERFEPHGSITHIFSSEIIDGNIKQIFKQVINDFTYLKPQDYIQSAAFQKFDTIDAIQNQIFGDMNGYCLLWCIWYADHKLKHPKILSKILVRKLLRHIQLSRIPFSKIIRNYTVRITDIRDKYLEMFGIKMIDIINGRISYEQMEELLFFMNKQKIIL